MSADKECVVACPGESVRDTIEPSIVVGVGGWSQIGEGGIGIAGESGVSGCEILRRSVSVSCLLAPVWCTAWIRNPALRGTYCIFATCAVGSFTTVAELSCASLWRSDKLEGVEGDGGSASSPGGRSSLGYTTCKGGGGGARADIGMIAGGLMTGVRRASRPRPIDTSNAGSGSFAEPFS